jgi:signal transduction histidine kinase
MYAGWMDLANFHSRPRCTGELYEPIAEDKHVTLRVDAADDAVVRGDRDLLFEAIANLVDSAGGRVELRLLHRDGEAAIRVKDTGPGIPRATAKRSRDASIVRTRVAAPAGLGSV